MKRQKYTITGNTRTRVAPEAAWLKGFTFAHQSNIKKKTLNNRDAITVLLYRCGTLSTSQLRDALMTWRFGEATYTRDLESRWESTKRWTAKMSFTAYFNVYYQHTGIDFGSEGEMVFHYGFWDRSISEQKRVRESWESFRRHFWYRSSPSQYALTLTGYTRINELIDAGMEN